MNYDLVFESGQLYQGMPFLRAVARKDGKENGQILANSKPGYGVTEIDAANDFIRRNSDATLKNIWDSK